jgi:hypothetical protein
VINDTSGGIDPDDDWVWIHPPAGGGNMYYSLNGGGSWTPSISAPRFQLDNSFFIPEPSTTILLTAGLAGLAATKRRRSPH